MHWFTDSLIHWFIGSCFVASFIHWFIDSLIRRIIGSLVHWFIRLVVPGFFHVISLAPQPPFRWCTSQLQHLVASASQKKHRPLISYSHFIFSKLPPAQAGHYLLSRNAGYSNIEGFPAKKKGMNCTAYILGYFTASDLVGPPRAWRQHPPWSWAKRSLRWTHWTFQTSFLWPQVTRLVFRNFLTHLSF